MKKKRKKVKGPTQTKRPKRRVRRYRPEDPVKIYDLLRAGMTLAAAAQALGTRKEVVERWCGQSPELAYAVAAGREARAARGAESFREFIAGRLPDRLRAVYDELERADDEPNPIRRLELLMEDQGKRAKQRLFLHALFANNFNPSAARRMTGVTRRDLNTWKAGDPDFMEMAEEVMEAKKDFVEAALMQGVKAGDTAAVIFANKTLNADRGYDPKVRMELTGKVVHAHVNLDAVMDRLSVGAQRELVEALEAAAEGPRRVEALEAHNEDQE